MDERNSLLLARAEWDKGCRAMFIDAPGIAGALRARAACIGTGGTVNGFRSYSGLSIRPNHGRSRAKSPLASNYSEQSVESNIHVTGLVILAALSHATWNAIVKNNEDSLSAMAMVMGTGAVAGAVAIPFMPALPREIWGYLVLSVVLHLAYQLLLVRAYRLADLSQVFPIFRGIPPILVALLSGIIAGESLASAQVAGIFVISVGIGSLAFHRGWPQGRDRIALTYAGGTAVAITSYTFADGLGVRLSGDSLAYAAWLFLFNGLPYVLIAWAVRGNGLWPLVRRNWKTGLGSGVVAIGGFSIVLWAFAHAPLAAVSAVRETSVIFAAVIGAVFLREPFGRMRILAAILVAAGVALLQVGI